MPDTCTQSGDWWVRYGSYTTKKGKLIIVFKCSRCPATKEENG